MRFPLRSAVFGFLPVLCIFGSVPNGKSAEVRLETSDGEVIVGDWAGVSEEGIRIDRGAKIESFHADRLASMVPSRPPQSGGTPPLRVTLVDGTAVVVQEVTMKDATIKVDPRRQDEFSIPIKHVRSVRFRPSTPTVEPQWLGLLDKETRSDLMVIRRGNDQLDPIEGVVVGLDAQFLYFELDGDKIEAPRDRLEGVVLRSNADSATKPKVKVTDRYGSTYFSNRLEPSDDNASISVLLPGQVKHQIPIDQVVSATWSSGRLLLASEDAASSDSSLYLKTRLSNDLANAWFGPISRGEDIVASAGGNIEFRIPEGFQTFQGSVERDESVAAGSSVSVRVLIDGEVNWEQSLSDRKPKGFRIRIAGGRRIRLEVLAGADGDVGDEVRFLKPRLIK